MRMSGCDWSGGGGGVTEVGYLENEEQSYKWREGSIGMVKAGPF